MPARVSTPLAHERTDRAGQMAGVMFNLFASHGAVGRESLRRAGFSEDEIRRHGDDATDRARREARRRNLLPAAA